MGARSGDLVRALDAWDLAGIQGVLHLQSGSDGVRVLVEGVPVIAGTVEVIDTAVLPADSFDAEDKETIGSWDDDWRPVHDLDQALVEGLVSFVSLRELTYREDAYACARAAIQPLQDGGWQLKEEQAWVFDQEFSVMESLERDGIIVDIECYEGRLGLSVWTYSSDYEPDPEGEGMEASFDCTNNEELWSRFADEGWLRGGQPFDD